MTDSPAKSGDITKKNRERLSRILRQGDTESKKFRFVFEITWLVLLLIFAQIIAHITIKETRENPYFWAAATPFSLAFIVVSVVLFRRYFRRNKIRKE